MSQLTSNALEGTRTIDGQIVAVASIFNARSARLQRSAMVDPMECLRLGIVAGEARTKFSLFFKGLMQRVWVSPRQGDWYDHDEENHWLGVRELHPKSVDMVVKVAGVGLELVEAGDRVGAQIVAWGIDFFVDKDSSEQRYEDMVVRAGLPLLDIPDYEAQRAHYERMRNTQAPLFKMPSAI